MSENNSAQERFDELYITSSEIGKVLNVSRPTIMSARKRGLLPDPIIVANQIFIWERESVKENIEAWRLMLKVRRSA